MFCRQALSYFLLFVFTLLSVPKELIHELHHHEDTVHHLCNHDFSDEKVEGQHLHCDYLKLEINPFIRNSNFFLQIVTVDYAEFNSQQQFEFYFPVSAINHLRGPPFRV